MDFNQLEIKRISLFLDIIGVNPKCKLSAFHHLKLLSVSPTLFLCSLSLSLQHTHTLSNLNNVMSNNLLSSAVDLSGTFKAFEKEEVNSHKSLLTQSILDVGTSSYALISTRVDWRSSSSIRGRR